MSVRSLHQRGGLVPHNVVSNNERYVYGLSIMRLVVIGVNHKTAPIALRERLAFVGDDLTAALGQLKVFTDGSVIVSTCNRTEIYALVPQIDLTALDSASTMSLNNSTSNTSTPNSTTSCAGVTPAAMNTHIHQIKTWLSQFKQLPLAEIEPYLYVHRDTHALTHWLRVAAGLDSMILGEP